MFVQNYRCGLVIEVNSIKCREAFERLKKKHGVFKRYSTADSLCVLFAPGNKDHACKDEIMSIFLRELKISLAIYPLLNLMFWESLYYLYLGKCRQILDHEELFSRIQWDFLHTAIDYDLERRPIKIDVNLVLDTKMKISIWQAETISCELQQETGDLDRLDEAEALSPDLREITADPEEVEGYLLDMVYRKVITELQYDLLLETAVYRKMTQIEWAEKRGMEVSTVRTLKERARKAIKRFREEKGRNI